MFYVDCTTDGEFNSLHWKGNTHPLTVLQIKSEARSCYRHKKMQGSMGDADPFRSDVLTSV